MNRIKVNGVTVRRHDPDRKGYLADSEPFRILFVEDVESDAQLIQLELKNAGIRFDHHRVDNESEYLDQLDMFRPDAVISDYHLPGFSALTALRLLRKRQSDIPFLLVTGSQSEEIAVDCIRQGADDYLLKQSLARLPSALLSAIEKKQFERERQNAMVELQKSRENLRALSARLQSIREEERTRIAREIHDELGQALTALKMDVLWLHGKVSPMFHKNSDQIDETVRSMTQLIDSTINSVRRIATELRPGVLDDLGLVPAIEWQAQEFQKRTGITTKFTSTIKDVVIERDRSTTLFRILQEALTNVVRHSGALNVHIVLEVLPERIVLIVDDDGKGIKTERIESPTSLGLLGMKERVMLQGGRIMIAGSPHAGTRITVSIPKSVPLSVERP